MANVHEIKTRISLDGETAYRQALKSIDANLRILANETKTVANSFDKSKASIKNYTDLNAALSKQIQQQEVKVKSLNTIVKDSADKYQKAKEKQEDITKEYGKNHVEAQKAARGTEAALNALMKYQAKLASAEAALSKMNKEYRNNAEAIEQLANAQNEAATKTEGGNSKLLEFATTAGKTTATIGALVLAVKGIATAVKGISSTAIQAVTKDVELSTKAFETYYKTALQAVQAISKATYETGSSFQTEMSKVQAYSGLDKMSNDFKALTDAAAETGKMTARTATEAAQALEYMALAGFDTDEMLAGLNPLVLASEAGLMDMKSASDLVTDSMAVLGLQADDMARFLDVATAAQNNSNTSLQQFLEAIIPVGGTMKELNVPLEEMAVLLGILANRGLKSSESGHKLNSVLVNLIGANKSAKTALTDLGVSAWNSDGTFKGITQTLLELDAALQHVSDEDKVNFEAKIGGKLQMDTLQKLIAGVRGEFSELNDTIENSNGVLEKTARTMYDNVSGAVTYLQSAIDGLKTAAFDSISEPLKEAVQDVTYYIQRIAEAYEAGGLEHAVWWLTDYAKKGIENFLSETAAILVDGYERFQVAYDNVFLAGVDAAAKILPTLLPRIMSIVKSSFTNVTQGLVPYAQTAVNAIADVVFTMIPSIITSFNTFIADSINSIDFGELITKITGQIEENVPAMIQSGFDVINAFLSGINEIIESGELYTIADVLLTNLGENLMNSLNLLVDVGSRVVDFLLDTIIEYAPEMMQGASEILTKLINAITDNIEDLSTAATEIVIGLVDLIAENVEPLVNCAIQLVSTLAEKLVTEENLNKIINSALLIVSGLIRGIVDAAPALFKAVSEIAKSIFSYLLSGDFMVSLGNFLNDVFASIVSFLGEAIFGISDFIGESIAGIKEGILNFNSKDFKGIWDGFANSFSDSMENGMKTLDEYTKDITDRINEDLGITKIVDVELSANVETNTDEISNQIETSFNAAISSVDENSLKSKFTMATGIDEFNKNAEKLSQIDTNYQFYADSTQKQIIDLANQNQVDNTPQFEAIVDKLASIEDFMNRMTLTINTTNYMYPDADTMYNDIKRINMMNNVVTGGY